MATLGDDMDADWFIGCLETANRRRIRGVVLYYPHIKLGPRVRISVQYHPHARVCSIDIADNQDFVLTLTEADWEDFIKKEHIVLPLLKALEASEILTDYIRNNPEIKNLSLAVDKPPPNQKLFTIEINEKLALDIVYSAPQGFTGYAYCVRFRSNRPLAVPENCPLAHKKTNHMLLAPAEFDYLSRFGLKQLAEGLSCWQRTAPLE